MIVANTWKLLIHTYFDKNEDYFWMNLLMSTLTLNSHSSVIFFKSILLETDRNTKKRKVDTIKGECCNC